MYNNSFLDCFHTALIGAAFYGFIFFALSLKDKITEQDEQIEELFSRLEDCEEKNAENHELKKIIIQYIKHV